LAANGDVIAARRVRGKDLRDAADGDGEIKIRARAGGQRSVAEGIGGRRREVDVRVRTVPEERAGDVRDGRAAGVARTRADLKSVGADALIVLVAVEADDVPRHRRNGQLRARALHACDTEEERQQTEAHEERRAAHAPRCTRKPLDYLRALLHRG
jgi:hypothetical protein